MSFLPRKWPQLPPHFLTEPGAEGATGLDGSAGHDPGRCAWDEVGGNPLGEEPRHGKTMEKPRENPWKTHGKTHGKPKENYAPEASTMDRKWTIEMSDFPS